MLKQNKHEERSADVNEPAKAPAEEFWGGTETGFPTRAQVSALMAHLGRKGGKIGGKRRLQTMTQEKRSAIARKAAQARWAREAERTEQHG